MTTYSKSPQLKRQHAKMNRVAEIETILSCFDEGSLTTSEIATQTEIPHDKLRTGMLTELTEYGILEKTNQGGGRGNESTWAVANPSKIERLKADMMGAKA